LPRRAGAGPGRGSLPHRQRAPRLCATLLQGRRRRAVAFRRRPALPVRPVRGREHRGQRAGLPEREQLDRRLAGRHTGPSPARRPKGIIFSGGPKSVHVEGAPSIDDAVYASGVPVLGICYGAQLVALQLGGEVARTGRGEYGRTPMQVVDGSVLLGELPPEQDVWMSHFDSIVAAPPGFRVT